MNPKLPEEFVTFYEELLSAQLRVVRRYRAPKVKETKGVRRKGMSKIDMVIDVLRRARHPLHISEIIAEAKVIHGIRLDRESLVSAMVKKVHQNRGVVRTAPNTFGVSSE